MRTLGCCGYACDDCQEYKVSCAGCKESLGKAPWISYRKTEHCPIYQCCIQQKRLEHCGHCPELPCQRFTDYQNPALTAIEAQRLTQRQLALLQTMAQPREIRPILWGTPAYQEALRLRHEIMRVPLGLSLYDEDLDAEKTQFHFGLYLGETLTAVGVLQNQGNGVAYLRQIAVQPLFQGYGLGKQLLLHLEAFAKERGFQRLTMHARSSAKGFYEKLGYHTEGEEFIQVTIPHWIMEKEL